MRKTRRRIAAWAAFALLALVAELSGRSFTLRIDRALHVAPFATPGTSYYPFLLAAVKILGALALAALAWRIVRAHVTASAGEHLLASIDRRSSRHVPPLRLRLSPKLWFASFVATSIWYLIQTEAAPLATGRMPSLAPWLHTYALPVFAVLAVLLAVAWGAVASWLEEADNCAAASLAFAHRILRPVTTSIPHVRPTANRGPRRLFGLAFESRPPPRTA